MTPTHTDGHAIPTDSAAENDILILGAPRMSPLRPRLGDDVAHPTIPSGEWRQQVVLQHQEHDG